MSDPLDVHRILEHCMQTIEAGREAMARDMYDAAMRLGAAEMMLASASHAVHKHAAALRKYRGNRAPPQSKAAKARKAPVPYRTAATARAPVPVR